MFILLNMEKTKKLISLKSIERLFKIAGAERLREIESRRQIRKIRAGSGAERISKKAKIALKEFLEEKGKEIATLAIRNAVHFGRKEIKETDLSEAIKELEG